MNVQNIERIPLTEWREHLRRLADSANADSVVVVIELRGEVSTYAFGEVHSTPHAIGIAEIGKQNMIRNYDV